MSFENAPPRPGGTALREPDLGALLSASLLTTGYGFRRHPYADRQLLRLTYAAQEAAFRASYDGQFHRENSQLKPGLLALVSRLEVQRFFGLGNDTSIEGDPDAYKVDLRQYILAPTLSFGLGRKPRCASDCSASTPTRTTTATSTTPCWAGSTSRCRWG